MTDSTIPARGDQWLQSSLVWGHTAGHGETSDSLSPWDGSLVQRVALLSDAEQRQLLQGDAPAAPLSNEALEQFGQALQHHMRAILPLLIEACRWETGFSRTDCEELQTGTLHYIEGFAQYRKATIPPPAAPLKYFDAGRERQIHLAHQAWGTIAIILPQNAAVLVGVVAMLNALATGNRVILRPPLQGARSAALLARAIERAARESGPSLQNRVSVVMTRARSFLQEICAAPLPALIHYMGSSGHVPSLLADAWAGGKNVIADGTGNVWVWVGPATPIEDAVKVLSSGALRYNGQTCTSINGALIHPTIYDGVRERLLAHWKTLRAAAMPDNDCDVGPLFDEQQAVWCQDQVTQSGGTVLCGGNRQRNLLSPTLLEHPDCRSSLVRDGVFGPVLWLSRGDAGTFKNWWVGNRYPLCAGVLGVERDDDLAASWALRNLARLVVNGDPSVEYIYEPWGGYAASGFNAVGDWLQKYARTISLDVLAQ